ncbi:hypothetical protein [Ferrimonas senticii]|uniref:hypothetical protein n=1 Tax=Ferrimonas senticii TaxID=394566 RepID=UPI0004136D46|nr:hypothetical protein [Ferrimonas senticii]
MNPFAKPSLSQQHGVALLSALVVLLMVSVLGVAVGKQVLDSRRNATVHYDLNNSYLRAQSALSEARAVINENHPSINDKLNPDSATPIVTKATELGGDDWWKTPSRWATAVTVTDHQNATLAGAPKYMLVDGGKEPSLDMGRHLPTRRFIKVVSQADGDGEAQSMIQAYVAVME